MNYFSPKTCKTDYPNNIFEYFVVYHGCTSETIINLMNNQLTEDQRKGFDYVLSSLDHYDKEIIELRFKEKKSLREIGDIYGKSSERIRQNLVKALRRIRHPERMKYIRYGYDITEQKN